MPTLFWHMQRAVDDARCFGPGFVLRHWTRIRREALHRWKMNGIGEVSVRHGTTDIAVMRQVFEGREYDIARYGQYAAVRDRYDAIRMSGRLPLIIDAGANIGATSLWFAREFQHAHVIAVEPEAGNAACCRTNVENHKRITVREAAIGSQPGRVSLHNPSGHTWAPRSSRNDVGAIDVVTIPELVASIPDATLFLVKIDIEGFESDLFAGNLGWIDDAAAILIEMHDWMLPGSGSSFAVQKAMGERRFEMVLSGENLLYFNTAKVEAVGPTALEC